MSNTYDQAVANDNPLAWWPLNDAYNSATAADASGNGYTGTVTGTVTFSATGPTSDSCASFGANGGITFALPTNAVTNVTLEAWLYLPSLAGIHGLALFLGANATNGYGIGIGTTNGNTAGVDAVGVYPISGSWLSTGVAYTVGWNHVVLVIGATGLATIYVNGVNTGYSSSATPIAPTGNGYIGVQQNVNYIVTKLAHLAVYGQALSAARVYAHYNAAVGASPPTSLLGLGQMTYNGVLLGPGGTAQIVDVDGLTGLPSTVRTGDVSRPNADGLLSGYDWLADRLITLDLEVTATGGFSHVQNLNILRAAMQKSTYALGGIPGISSATQQLAYNFGEGTTRAVGARVRKFDAQVDAAFSSGAYTAGVISIAVQLSAADPTIYDANVQTATSGLDPVPGGWTFPWTFPWTFTSAGGAAPIYTPNTGWATCSPLITIVGPVTNPSVIDVTSGVGFAFNLTLPAGNTLVVDCYAGTAIQSGYLNRLDKLFAGSQFPSIPPGTSQFQFVSADAAPTGATCTVAWSNAYT